MVPFLQNGHFSVYVINFNHHRVDILDPNDWKLIGDGWKQAHKGMVQYRNNKGQWCRLMMRRLNEAIQVARPDSRIPKFGNYKCELLHDIHKQRIGSNDCGFYCMWHMEYYDANTAKVLWPYSVSFFFSSNLTYIGQAQPRSQFLCTYTEYFYTTCHKDFTQKFLRTFFHVYLFSHLICKHPPSSYGPMCSNSSSSTRQMSKKNSQKKLSSSAHLSDICTPCR